MATFTTTLRRGLPREAGGEPWPPGADAATAGGPVMDEPVTDEPVTNEPVTDGPGPRSSDSTAETSDADSRVTGQRQSKAKAPNAAPPARLRRGLPRVPGGEPWPVVAEAEIPKSAEPAPAPAPAPEPVPQPAAPQSAAAPAPAPDPAAASTAQASRGSLIKRGLLWVLGAIVAAGIVVLTARGVTTLPGVPEFLQRYPGEYEPGVEAEPGFAPWVRWSHFLNFFFLVLIIRTGLLVRHQRQPSAFFTPKRGGKKVSLYLWLHTSIDVLWLLNGIAFVTLLFVTGHWARIVPTSWEVFPNAASALLQYLTLEWPSEDGWVNYNSLQQLMYFAVVFIAAPLAAITGARMSQWWPAKAERLNRIFPAPLARTVHYPTMLLFVLFVIAHVCLVFATGALRNLNHMFAGTTEVSWMGFAWFAAGAVVTVAVTAAARPLVIAPIANLFGRVSER